MLGGEPHTLVVSCDSWIHDWLFSFSSFSPLFSSLLSFLPASLEHTRSQQSSVHSKHVKWTGTHSTWGPFRCIWEYVVMKYEYTNIELICNRRKKMTQGILYAALHDISWWWEEQITQLQKQDQTVYVHITWPCVKTKQMGHCIPHVHSLYVDFTHSTLQQ